MRQAVSLAIDRQAIVRNLVASFARPSTSALTPIMRGYANLGEIRYDPDKARALLKAAGYGNGFATKIATTPRYPMGVELAEAVSADLKKVGITATIEVYDWATMVQFWAGLPPEKNPQEIFIMGAGASTADADWGLRPIFRSAATNENNYGYYSNAEFDQVIEAAMRETDAVKRQALYTARAGDRLPRGSRRGLALRHALQRGRAQGGHRPASHAARRRDLRTRGRDRPLNGTMRGLARLVTRALARLVPVLLAISLLVFSIVHVIPGDPAVIAAGLEASPATVERIRRDLGLDQPLPVQFASFVTRTLGGDLGLSIRTGVPVGGRSSIGCRTRRFSPPAACCWRSGWAWSSGWPRRCRTACSPIASSPR